MIDVQVAEQEDIELRHLCAAFAESQRASTARVDCYFRLTVFPQEIAA